MNEIVKTRQGNLGSSDARIVYNVGKVGELTQGARTRIYQLRGDLKVPEFKNKYTERGHKRELDFYDRIKSTFVESYSNPLYVSERIQPKNFNVICHIDIECVDPIFKKLYWYECKSTETHKTIEEVFEEYKYQLQWHWMLLEEKCSNLNYSAELRLVWFNESNNGELVCLNVEKDNEIIETLKKGISIIDDNYASLELGAIEEVNVDSMPLEIQKVVSDTANALSEVERLNRLVEEFKDRILTVMLDNNIKSIKNDYINITLVPETESVTIDTKKLKAEYPDIAKQYERVTKRKPYVMIKIK